MAPLPDLPVVPPGQLPTEAVADADATTHAKWDRLVETLAGRGRTVLVAYSGGVDSALIAAAALQAVGPWDPTTRTGALAVLADSSTLARRELTLARTTADAIGVPLHELHYSELDNAAWRANDGDRCYHCKKDLAVELNHLVDAWGLDRGIVAYGITTSDLGDHRPGINATREESGWHPLVEADLAKPEVRALAKAQGLPVWDKPATPCLASRVQYGETISEATLQRVERAEDAVRDLGFRVFRVRHHGTLARIEVDPQDLMRAFELRDTLVGAVRATGYTYVTLDLVGFRSGAMNEALATARSDQA